MFKIIMTISALIATSAAKPDLVGVAAPLTSSVVASAPIVTASSSQYFARNYNGLVGSYVAAAPYVAAPAPVVAAAPYVAAPAPVVAAASYVAAPAPFVTAHSSQYVARNYNGLVGPYVAAPALAAPARVVAL